MAGGVHGRGCAWKGGRACMAVGMHTWYPYMDTMYAGGMLGRGGGMCGRGNTWQGGMCGRGASMASMMHWTSLSPSPGADPGFGQGEAQVLRLKVADVVKWSHVSETSNLWPGSRACLRILEAFGVFNTQICILPHSRDSFL